jgi:hypothetical protein
MSGESRSCRLMWRTWWSTSGGNRTLKHTRVDVDAARPGCRHAPCESRFRVHSCDEPSAPDIDQWPASPSDLPRRQRAAPMASDFPDHRSASAGTPRGSSAAARTWTGLIRRRAPLLSPSALHGSHERTPGFTASHKRLVVSVDLVAVGGPSRTTAAAPHLNSSRPDPSNPRCGTLQLQPSSSNLRVQHSPSSDTTVNGPARSLNRKPETHPASCGFARVERVG